MTNQLPITLFLNSHDNVGKAYTPTWEQLAPFLAKHERGEKDGRAFACGTFQGDGKRITANRHMRSLVALDIETNRSTGEGPIPPQMAAEYLKREKQAAVVYTTYNHKVDNVRYRIVMPLDKPIDLTSRDHMLADGEITLFTAAMFDHRCDLPWIMPVIDRSKTMLTSLFYTGRTSTGRPGGLFSDLFEHTGSWIVEGDPLYSEELLVVAKLNALRNFEIETAQRQFMEDNRNPGWVAAREAFNDEHPLRDTLRKYGYTQHGGDRWRSPLQSSEAPATTIFPDERTWASFSDSDARAGLGLLPKAGSQCACWGDAFSLFTFFEHNNSLRDAMYAWLLSRNRGDEGHA